MQELYFTTIDISDKTEEEIGEIVDKVLAKEEFVILENKSCGYSSFIVPSKCITSERLVQSIQMEPIIDSIQGYAEQLKSELHALNGFIKKIK